MANLTLAAGQITKSDRLAVELHRQGARINRYDRTLSCRGCGSYTWHVVVGQNPAEDWREQANYGRYDPIADLRQRWPGWRIECKHLDDCGEAFTLSEKLIELDVDLFNQDWGNVPDPRNRPSLSGPHRKRRPGTLRRRVRRSRRCRKDPAVPARPDSQVLHSYDPDE